ncbi:MAG: DNA-directed RNA polymerase subunit omega [Candidatus Margulisiibacteriota bacterium]|nr:MAG: DNA-directed RNA polymerase subunit omega [Candidatus Margulisbacteria bacterium GWD2_39_127]OGI01676.1 MAG: DNA-directed RNA polymerase subunit omega [Candidatus Margulisbacteria bacterium GWF2_38_17]OGI05849.1 MAG: DNA-directed RNA polymerase subunit omega [Candidatus Margulisbacteria bacterium GWE2_39_32]PZM81847.1 MAG: DNA-directed RNA polymerase subunit omega [Candidatus Margulisiibacteriota bacterium]HAR63104.1 DNA-directed RNA polymerase subunit omega [Candidatus Margulisiibacter
MTQTFSFDNLVKKFGNKFLLTTAVAKRAIQIKEGDSSMVDDNSSRPIIAAIQEFEDQKITMGISSRKEVNQSQAIFEEEDDFEEDEELKPEDKKKEVKKKKTKAI